MTSLKYVPMREFAMEPDAKYNVFVGAETGLIKGICAL